MPNAQAVAVLHFSFVGRNGVGAVSVPGLQIGDLLTLYSTNWDPIVSTNVPFLGTIGGSTIGVVDTADEIHQQYTTDYSATTFHLIVYRLIP